jgi:hypothetical protein
MEFSDLTDEQYVELADRCFEDGQLIEDFIAYNYEDFEQEMGEHGIDPDYYCDHEFDYCESNDDSFLEFGFKKYYGGSK